MAAVQLKSFPCEIFVGLGIDDKQSNLADDCSDLGTNLFVKVSLNIDPVDLDDAVSSPKTCVNAMSTS